MLANHHGLKSLWLWEVLKAQRNIHIQTDCDKLPGESHQLMGDHTPSMFRDLLDRDHGYAIHLFLRYSHVQAVTGDVRSKIQGDV